MPVAVPGTIRDLQGVQKRPGGIYKRARIKWMERGRPPAFYMGFSVPGTGDNGFSLGVPVAAPGPVRACKVFKRGLEKFINGARGKRREQGRPPGSCIGFSAPGPNKNGSSLGVPVAVSGLVRAPPITHFESWLRLHTFGWFIAHVGRCTSREHYISFLVEEHQQWTSVLFFIVRVCLWHDADAKADTWMKHAPR